MARKTTKSRKGKKPSIKGCQVVAEKIVESNYENLELDSKIENLDHLPKSSTVPVENGYKPPLKKMKINEALNYELIGVKSTIQDVCDNENIIDSKQPYINNNSQNFESSNIFNNSGKSSIFLTVNDSGKSSISLTMNDLSPDAVFRSQDELISGLVEPSCIPKEQSEVMINNKNGFKNVIQIEQVPLDNLDNIRTQADTEIIIPEANISENIVESIIDKDINGILIESQIKLETKGESSDVFSTQKDLNNLGEEIETPVVNIPICQATKVEMSPCSVSIVDLDDNHILKDIESLSESRIKTLDIVTYVENMTSENRKIYEEMLIQKLFYARNFFINSPPEWYETFEQLQHYHQEILKNITDFNIWVSLLQYSESLLRNTKIIQEGKQHLALSVLKNSFDEFLQRYPYCYGYWKNYADIVKKLGNMEDVYKIYERALETFPNSVDLWVFFINFVIENTNISSEKFSSKNIENLLDQALKMVGSDYKSEPLWDLYITWEMRMGNMRKVTKILDLAMKESTSAYKQFFERFKNHVETNDLQDILSEEELEIMKKALNINSQPMPSYNYHPFNHMTDVMIRYKFYEMPDEQIISIREKLIETREEIMNDVEADFKKRKTFEDNIKRPYFHIKPLERSQLKNWNQYLDFELAQVPDIEKGELGILEKRKRVHLIFERCLITCALYEEFWIKYAQYLEGFDIPAMRRVFQRACFVHLETQPNPFLVWSALEEKYGNLKATSFLLNLINRNIPGLVQVNLRMINLFRRYGDIDKVEYMYRESLTKYESNLCYYSFFTIHFARFMHKVMNNKPQAIKLLEDALINDPHNEKLYLQLIDIQYQSYPLDIERIVCTFDKVLGGTLPDTSKTAFAQRKYEFLENFDNDVVRINKARDDFMILLKNQLGGDFSSNIQKSYVKGNVPLATNAVAAVIPSVAPQPSQKPISACISGSNDYYQAAYYQQWAAASAFSYPSYPPVAGTVYNTNYGYTPPSASTSTSIKK